MFVQGKRPTLLVARGESLERFRMAMRRAGYAPHTGHRYMREGEIGAWARDLPSGRHVHVQEVSWTHDRVAIFAHTEPADGIAHVISAIFDKANYPAGARTLRTDLRRHGFTCTSGRRADRSR